MIVTTQRKKLRVENFEYVGRKFLDLLDSSPELRKFLDERGETTSTPEGQFLFLVSNSGAIYHSGQ